MACEVNQLGNEGHAINLGSQINIKPESRMGYMYVLEPSYHGVGVGGYHLLFSTAIVNPGPLVDSNFVNRKLGNGMNGAEETRIEKTKTF